MMRRLRREIMNGLDVLAKEYLSHRKSFEDIADEYLLGLISLRYFVEDETAFSIMRNKFNYLISVYETHDKGAPVSGFVRPFIDRRFKVEHDMNSIMDYAIYLSIYENTPEAETKHYKLAKEIFTTEFNKHYLNMDFDCNDWPVIVGLMSRFNVFNDLPYNDVRKILLEKCDDKIIHKALTGKVEDLFNRELRNPKAWIYYVEE